MKKEIILITILFTVSALYGCNQKHSVEISASIAVTDTPIPSNTPSITPTKENTRTKTLAPTHTETILPVDVTQTEIAFQATEQYFYQITKTETYKTLVSTNSYCADGYGIATPWNGPFVDIKYSTATDQWSVISCMHWGDYETEGYTRVVNNNNSKNYFILYDDINLWDFGFLDVFHFDKQNQFLYFRPATLESPDGGNWGQGFGGGRSVFQLDLQTGDTMVIIPIPYDMDFQIVEFSPNKNYIAYSSSADLNIMKVLNTKNGQTIYSVPLDTDVTLIGDFVWTKNEKYIFYVACHDGWIEQQNGFSLYRFNLETQENEELIHNDMRVLMPYDFGYVDPWIDNQTLRLGAYHYDGYPHDNTFYKLNIYSDEITVGGKMEF